MGSFGLLASYTTMILHRMSTHLPCLEARMIMDACCRLQDASPLRALHRAHAPLGLTCTLAMC